MKDYILGYGSLLNRYSREYHSKIFTDVQRVVVHGWSRSWCAVYPDEGATYAGAYQSCNSSLDAVLIPTEINDGIRERERNYRFVELAQNDFDYYAEANSTDNLSEGGARYWICEIVEPRKSSRENPLPQSYVDTCLLGSIEAGGMEAAQRFIEQTSAWDGYWQNDRHIAAPIYPRHAPTGPKDWSLIDNVLEQAGVIQHRQG